MESALPMLVLACAVAVALSVGSIVWVTVFSSPARLVQLERACAAQQADWVAYKASMEGILESIDGQLESVERKRRQVTAAASRIAPPNAEPAHPQSRADILRPYRQAAFGGGAEG